MLGLHLLNRGNAFMRISVARYLKSNYALVYIDSYFKWLDVVFMGSPSGHFAQRTMDHGGPHNVSVTDNGTHFIANNFTNTLSDL